MSPAEFRCLYELLGLTPEWVAAHLDVSGDQVMRWAAGDEPVPNNAADELSSLATMTAKLVHELAIAHQWGGSILTYRDDTEFQAVDPFGLTYPASWHRAVAARVADRCVGVEINYPAKRPAPQTEDIEP